MKRGPTHLANKAEHVVNLETGAVTAVTVQPGDRGDTSSMASTLAEAGVAVTEMAGRRAAADAVGMVDGVTDVGVEVVVADKGYHSRESVLRLAQIGVRTVISEPERGPQN